ncbi:hypothetical protein HN51_002186 [Arachis hypogaea]|uniref:SCP domain-containing protein n=2 Tax=Arachis TaxID=3817 RepID=A0A445ENF9_ARAHY|nr:pathogenesis-related protein PR-1 [Arachis duranensis]XP_025607435.1 pathogenesis-related protein PR-1 [Arachis hypogaea]QHO50360.1 Pathogenesis-related protein [Arachis hypogaea]RYR76990.1 hypothetical protein Ahy_A01g001484 [Arachis hypogaea]
MSHPTHSLWCFATVTITLLLLLASSAAQDAYATLPAQQQLTQNRQRSLASQFLVPQNAARSVLRLRPLTWSAKLTRYAQWYANQRRNDCALQHSNGPYGENIFWGSGTGWSPAQAVDAWVSERQYYNYWRNSCANGEMCGHYTQVVWSSTRKVGCAVVTCNGGKGQFMTCNYDPPGNYIGERPY